MTDLKSWLKPKLLLTSLAISLALSIVGVFLSPRLYAVGTTSAKSAMLFLGAGVVLVATVFVLLAFAFLFTAARKSGDQSQRPYIQTFGGLLVLALLLAAASLVISALYGLLAVLINALLKSSLSFAQIKGVINLVTTLITLALAPFLLNILLTYGIDEQDTRSALSTGIKISGKHYVRFLILVAAGYGLGWLIALPFRYQPATLPFQIMRAILLALAGMLVLVAALALYKETPGKVRS